MEDRLTLTLADGATVGTTVAGEMIVGFRTGNAGEYFVETLSFRPLGESETCSYLTEWKLNRTTDAMIDGGFDTYHRVWGPGELGMVIGRLDGTTAWPPDDAAAVSDPLLDILDAAT